MNKQLFIWVEGSDDTIFVENIIKPCLEKQDNLVNIIEYAKNKNEYVENFLKSIIQMKADYIYLADIDLCSCITEKKDRITKNIKNIDINRIVVVCKEIESWYYGGLTQDTLEGLKIDKPTQFKNTDSLTKEQFNDSIPTKFKDSRIDFMEEILKLYNLSHAMENQTNKSLNYFIKKYQILLN